MGKELEVLEERPKAKIHPDSIRATLKQVPNWKRQTMIAYMDTGLKNSLLSMTDYQNK